MLFPPACSVRNGFNQSSCRTKEQKNSRLQCLASAMSKFVMPSRAKKREVSKEAKRKNMAMFAETPRLNLFFQEYFQAATFKQWR